MCQFVTHVSLTLRGSSKLCRVGRFECTQPRKLKRLLKECCDISTHLRYLHSGFKKFVPQRTHTSQSILGPRDRAAGASSIVLAVFGGSSNCTHVVQVRTRLPQAAVDDAASGQARSPSHPKLASSPSHHTTTISITITSPLHSLHILIKLHLFSSFSLLIVAMKTSAILLAAATAGSTTAAVHRMKLNKVPLSEQLVSVSRYRLARTSDSLRLSSY